MELGDFEEQFIDELSGGQRQRAYIAMVIAQDTEYILLDEPTNNLDIYHATNLMRIVRRLCDELGKTVILVLHEINYAAFYSDYICAFVDGKIAKFGTVQEVITKENLSDIYKVDFEIMQIEAQAFVDILLISVLFKKEHSYEENLSSFVFDRYGRCECSGCSYRLRRFLLHGKLRGILCGCIQRSCHFLGSCAGVCDHQGVQRCKGVSGRGSTL